MSIYLVEPAVDWAPPPSVLLQALRLPKKIRAQTFPHATPAACVSACLDIDFLIRSIQILPISNPIFGHACDTAEVDLILVLWHQNRLYLEVADAAYLQVVLPHNFILMGDWFFDEVNADPNVWSVTAEEIQRKLRQCPTYFNPRKPKQFLSRFLGLLRHYED